MNNELEILAQKYTEIALNSAEIENHDQEENQITSAEIFEAEKSLLQQLFVHDRKYFDALKQIVFN